MRELAYQKRVLDAVDVYLDCLVDRKGKADAVAQIASQYPDHEIPIPNFPKQAWEDFSNRVGLPNSRENIEYSLREDGCRRAVPNIVLKVPTGGGKTWLAVSSISKVMERYLCRNEGFVLWIVPNEAIYDQTLKNLRDRSHPYRKALDIAAAGKVMILEKNDSLDAQDVKSHLCVMLLMLQSANRQTRESLKLFRDRGDVHGFFPEDDDQLTHEAQFDEIPNLDVYEGLMFMIKASLGNALRLIRPVVVLDEGHRATSDLAYETLYGFNPCFVLELTATPHDAISRDGRQRRYSNVLVEVTGKEVDQEGMIKMPINLDPTDTGDWRSTLGRAVTKLRELDQLARQFLADTDRYIRPIILIQVERTGSDQRESGFIHAEDIREWLLTSGFDESEIAIKTTNQNDLKQPENQNLLSPSNRIRAIITKQALQEGWDCPFAYILCALSASSNLNAMTQLVGRILRQPNAEKTSISALNECYVVARHKETAKVVGAIKRGLERDGLGDLDVKIAKNTSWEETKVKRTIKRSEEFEETEIDLPLVMLVKDEDIRELDYETDILAHIDWRGFDPSEIANKIPTNVQIAQRQMQRISVSDQSELRVEGQLDDKSYVDFRFDRVHATRMLQDIVANPFVGYEIVSKTIEVLQGRGFEEKKIGQLSALIVDQLRKGLGNVQQKRAEDFFKKSVNEGHIQFRLRLDRRNWKMPYEIISTVPDRARKLSDDDGRHLKKNLFSPVFEDELNEDEQAVAIYLDKEETLIWWHRNLALRQYGLQGWKPEKMYPDFIFEIKREGDVNKVVVLETKGAFLDNPDTDYKRDVLETLSRVFTWDRSFPFGELELVENSGKTVEGALIFMDEKETELAKFFPSKGKK